jgi:hypothetical protein
MTKREHALYTAQDYRKHVLQLANAFHVSIREDPRRRPDQAAAGFLGQDALLPWDQRRRCAVFRPVKDESSYAVAMHELGHAVAPNGMLEYERNPREMTLRDFRLQLHCEEVAWDWAIHQALHWTPLMDAVRQMCLGFYDDHVHYLETGRRRR